MASFSTITGAGVMAQATSPDTSSNLKQLIVGAINIKGSYVELITSADFDAGFITINIDTQATIGDYLVDIAIGGAGSEVIIIPNLLFYLDLDTATYFNFPIKIPKGSRISARAQSSGGEDPLVGVSIYSENFIQESSLGRLAAYGYNTADSGGVGVTPGLNTKGSWVEIRDALPDGINSLCYGIGMQNNSGLSLATWFTDIAIGASGSEEIIIPDLLTKASTPEDVRKDYGIFPVHIPKGARVSARASCTVTGTDSLFDLVLYGVS